MSEAAQAAHGGAHAASTANVMGVTGLTNPRVAMWWFLASETLIFGGLLTIYALYRLGHPEWAEQAHHTLAPVGAINALVLLASSYFVVLAQQASERGEGKKASNMLWVTIALGALFLCIKAFEYRHEIGEGMYPGAPAPHDSVYWSFYFFITGLHGLHIVAGLVALSVVALKAGRGQFLHRVEYVGLYWHFVDIVWMFVFPILYLVSK